MVNLEKTIIHVFASPSKTCNTLEFLHKTGYEVHFISGDVGEVWLLQFRLPDFFSSLKL